MHKIATLYKFSRIQNPLKTHKNIRSNLKELNVKGTILVGKEGLNGTISATSEKKLSKAIKLKNINIIEGIMYSLTPNPLIPNLTWKIIASLIPSPDKKLNKK